MPRPCLLQDPGPGATYPGTDSWWAGANTPGKPRTLYPYVGGAGAFRTICQGVAEQGYQGMALPRTG